MFCSKLLAVLVIAVVSAVSADDSSRLIVQQSPAYQVYSYGTTLKLSDLKSLLLAINGFTVDREIEWTGLKSTKPKASPKVTLLVVTDSQKLDDATSQNSIQIEQDSSLDFDYLKRYFNSMNNGRFEKFDTIPTGESLKALACEKSLDSIVYVINADETDDLKGSVNALVESVKESCATGADDMLVYVLGVDKHSRARRDVREKRAVSSRSILNVAVFYSDNYPVMFHLLFWTSLVIGLTVIGITCGMYKMDPGLDTVIYRMTSQRIKKDN